MRFSHNVFTLFLIAFYLGTVTAKNSYIVLCPKTFRPGLDFVVNVNILKSTGPVTVTLELFKSKTSVASTVSTVTQGYPVNIKLKIPATLSYGKYKLHATGTGGLKFRDETTIEFKSKNVALFIQTDKAMYKPGQTVNFRTFGIYPSLRLYKGKMTVEITDSKTNKIKQWKDVQTSAGVYTNHLKLSDQPLLGDWKIKVIAGNVAYEQTFTIAEYVLPKFEVTVTLPPFVLTSAKDVSVKITAKYTYGKPVKGTVDLEAKIDRPQIRWFRRPGPIKTSPKSIIKNAQINGETTIVLSMSEIKTLSSYLSGRTLEVDAKVTESLTGAGHNGSSDVKIYDKAEKLEFLESNPKTFKPGLKYRVYIKVSQPDGRPVAPSNTKLTLKVKIGKKVKVVGPPHIEKPEFFTPEKPRLLRPENPGPLRVERAPRLPRPPFIPPDRIKYYYLPTMNLTVPVDGVVQAEFEVPTDATSVTLEAEYKNSNRYLSLKRSESPSNSYLEVSLFTSNISAGATIPFAVKSTQPLSTLVYQILSRGTIVKTGNVPFNWGYNSFFVVQATQKMAPSARIVVYYVRADGEVVVDSISFNVNGAFENKVSIAMNKQEAQPGDDVKVQVLSEPNSQVHLLAVDQSVLLLKSGNDITQAKVVDELLDFDSITSNRGGWWYPIYYGGSDATSVLRNAGVAVMTDALVYKRKPTFPWRGMDGPLFMNGLPPLAMAKSVGRPNLKVQDTAESSLMQVKRVRKLFPEQWLWFNATSNFGGIAEFQAVVPDTITSWVATAFAVSDTKGLGVTGDAANLRVFRPFFVSLNLPYSVTRGETVILQVLVFNYLGQDVNVVVTLDKSADFSNVIIDSTGAETTASRNQQETIRVKAGDARSVYFPIIPSRIGYIDIQVSGRTRIAADAVRRQLLVEPEGLPMEYNRPVLIDLKTAKSFSKTVSINFPPNVVDGSQRVKISAIGDLMGSSISGLENLLKMPYGCGEQNMLNFAPTVFVVNYLKELNQLDGSILSKAIGFMEIGYQRELTYQHKDGSFSAFGDSDPSGSMWLTAFVVKTFHQAKPHIFIDDKVLVRAIKWMIDHQDKNTGSFPEPGRVIHKAMQGGSSSGVSLTAFVLIALLENDNIDPKIQSDLDSAKAKAVAYLENNYNSASNNYTLAITCYALKLAKSPLFSTVFNKLKQNVITEGGLKHWHDVDTTTVSTSFWHPPHQSKARDIEMTSYALLVYAELNDITGGLDVMKWVIAQRNPHGGFASTQDTVVALQALSKFASKVYSPTFQVQINIQAGSFVHTFTVNKQNALILQRAELPSIPNDVQISATGSGMALVDVSVFFNVMAEVEQPSFDLNVKIETESVKMLKIRVCARWLKEGSSGMAVEEIGVPSGFSADKTSIGNVEFLKRIETADKKIILYFDEIGRTATCLSVELHRTGLVAKSQPAPVKVYDYYEPSNKAVAFYQSTVLKNTKICDVCKECPQCKKP